MVKLNAAKLAASSKELTAWFPPGSGQSAYAKSEALPVVWTDHAKFEEEAAALRAAVAKLDADAQAGAAEAIGADLKATAAGCKGCHETFEAKDKT